MRTSALVESTLFPNPSPFPFLFQKIANFSHFFLMFFSIFLMFFKSAPPFVHISFQLFSFFNFSLKFVKVHFPNVLTPIYHFLASFSLQNAVFPRFLAWKRCTEYRFGGILFLKRCTDHGLRVSFFPSFLQISWCFWFYKNFYFWFCWKSCAHFYLSYLELRISGTKL